jgi:hypothetical protein
MKLVVALVVAGVVAIGVSEGIKRIRPSDAEIKARVAKKLDDMRSEADRKYPGMAKSDAIRAVVTEESAKTMAAQDASERRKTAAGMFWGFYYTNTRERVAYCAARGVDIAPFKDAFESVHDRELVQARAVFAEIGQDPDAIYPMIKPQLTQLVDQDMRDIASAAKLSPEDTCRLLNDRAQEVAEGIVLPPHVAQALAGA